MIDELGFLAQVSLRADGLGLLPLFDEAGEQGGAGS